tara:strand:- start:264 stop:704 length:441 start_codon:yes stop_codon:yes gene_type:complete
MIKIINKITLVVITAFVITSCGYSSYEQCTLKEIQKCETGACNGAAYRFCDAKFPEKYKWEKSNETVYLDLKKNQLSFERKFTEEKYKLCLTHNSVVNCRELTVLSKYARNTNYGDFVLFDLYPNVLNAKSNSEITFKLEASMSYR